MAKEKGPVADFVQTRKRINDYFGCEGISSFIRCSILNGQSERMRILPSFAIGQMRGKR